eukprot:TRINITY_DN7219_c0_g1_i1.p1 TRINITY_DN7219_c0_g1~~TRINITY_DN7219_c0_g1_i1.p1  ORF type:complete len:228 (-),score=96.26 TRINITY_DN7219_c0_g1_i1:115-798(-)
MKRRKVGICCVIFGLIGWIFTIGLCLGLWADWVGVSKRDGIALSLSPNSTSHLSGNATRSIEKNLFRLENPHFNIGNVTLSLDFDDGLDSNENLVLYLSSNHAHPSKKNYLFQLNREETLVVFEACDFEYYLGVQLEGEENPEKQVEYSVDVTSVASNGERDRCNVAVTPEEGRRIIKTLAAVFGSLSGFLFLFGIILILLTLDIHLFDSKFLRRRERKIRLSDMGE